MEELGVEDETAGQTDRNKEEQEAGEAGGGARDLVLTCHLYWIPTVFGWPAW